MKIEELKNQVLQIMDEYHLTEFVKDKIVNVIDKYITEQEDDGSCGCEDD